MRSSVRIVCSALALAFALPVAPAVGQSTPFAKHEKARIEFEKLTASMQRLQVMLSETAPQESSVLRAGNEYVQEQRVDQRMLAARDLLRAGRWDEALEEMAGVRQDLEFLLQLLINREVDLDRLKKEIERLEAYKKRVEELIAEQQKAKEDAARSEALQKQLEAIARAKAEVDKLIQDQEAVREEANQAGLKAAEEDAERMAEREGELEQEAERLAEDLAELEQKQAELADPKAGAGGEPKAAEPTEGKPGEGKPGEGKPKEGKPKEGKSGEGKPGSCSGSCQGAAGAMSKAKQQLQKNAPERSLEDMDQALKALREAREALEQMSEEAQRALQQLPFEQQAKNQEVTRIKTDRLAQEMEQSKGPKDAPKNPAPGTKNVQQAVPKQKAAAGQLKEYKASKAKQDQQDAKAELEEAQKKLEDALAQLRQQLQDEVLRALEERFGAMLAQQKELSARTVVAERLRAESLTADGSVPAALVQRSEELSDGELELASEAHDALKLLDEEGTTAVFPEVVIELKEDLERTAGRLAAQKTALVTQNMQAEIEDTLKMLIDALRRTIELKEGGGNCGQCNGEPPLVPVSAEVKLILQLQKRVAKRTKTYDAAVPEESRELPPAVAEADEIARKQGRVRDLTRKLADKQNQQETEERR